MKKKRIQFDATKKEITELDDLKTKTGSASRVETIRRALRILKLITEERNRGGKILLVPQEGETREIWVV